MATEPSLGMEQPMPDPRPYVPHRKRLLTPERVRELSRLRPVRVVRDTLLCWFWIIAAWVMVAQVTTWWVVLLALPLIGSRYYALLIIGHDGLHRRSFPNVRINDLFCDLFIFGPIGAIVRINNHNHLRHHHHLATPVDPDRHKYARWNKVNGLQLFLYVLGIGSVFRSVKNVFFGSPLPVTPTERDQNTSVPAGYTGRDVLILLGWQVGLLVGLTCAIGWWAYLVLWWVPVYLFAFLGDNLRSFAEHSQPFGEKVEPEGFRLITFTSNPLERLFLAPMNMNYHAAHHLWPSIPYYNLPEANQEMRSSPFAHELEWRGSYVAYLWHYFQSLKGRKAEVRARLESDSRAA